ncbi:MAG: DUF7693 family protein [Chloroflexota bacterium]
MQNHLSEPELLQFLESIETGSVTLQAEGYPQEVYAGDVTYMASNGWRIVIFNDANEWDYIDSVENTDGLSLSFDEIQQMPIASAYMPSREVAWKRYRLPGYCVFRCENCGAKLNQEKLYHPPFLCTPCRNENIQKVLEQTLDLIKASPQDSVYAERSNLEKELTIQIESIKSKGVFDGERLKSLYAPTGQIQELSISNDWSGEFIELAKLVDTLSVAS